LKREFFGFPIWLLAIGLVCIIYHILVLPISPLPWFDETYFASMTLNFMETGEFNPKIGPLLDYYYPQSKAYGPGYFLVLASVYKFFGFGVFQTRIPGLLFGFITPFLGYKILKESGCKIIFCSFFVFLLLFDTIFLQNIHSGRMDSMALMLAFSGIYCLVVGLKNGSISSFILTGLFFGFAILTTPRIAVCLIGPALFLGFSFLRRPGLDIFKRAIVVLLLVLAIYSIWVFWGFGGPIQAYNYFFGAPNEKLYFNNLASAYMDARQYVPFFQIPAICISLLGVIYLLATNKLNQAPIFWIFILNLVAYYYLVYDTGIYSIFSVPFVYGLILYALNAVPLPFESKFYLKWILYSLLFFNIALFASKNILVWATSNTREMSTVQEQISKVIPKGSRVIGEEIFYYAVINSGSDFQYLDRGADGPRRRNYHEKVYDYQYVISRVPASSKAEFDYYNASAHLKLVHEIKFPKASGSFVAFRSFLAQLGFYFPRGYEGKIYRR